MCWKDWWWLSCVVFCSSAHESVIWCLSDVQCCLFILSSSALQDLLMDYCVAGDLSKFGDRILEDMTQFYLPEMVMADQVLCTGIRAGTIHRESRNDSASILRFSECFVIPLESILSLVLNSRWRCMLQKQSTLLVSKSLHTLEPKIIIHKIRKGWSELQGCSQWAVFTLISCHKSILSRGEITDHAQALFFRAFECVDKN